jgi:hypothetical protein
MANPICTDPVCDTTVPAVVVPTTPVPAPTCGLPTNQVFTHATIHTNASGCISHIESGTPFLYTPDPCCPASGTGTGGGTGLDGPQGAPGAAATVAIGTVTTGSAGSSASVVNIGTANAAILNITIPAGAAGLDGATPSGLDYTTGGLVIDNGLVQQLPSWWPPVHTFAPVSSTNNGVTIVFAKDPTGSVVATVDASVMQNNINLSQSAQDTNINALTATMATMQADLNTLTSQYNVLNTAHNTLKARVDAAGIP